MMLRIASVIAAATAAISPAQATVTFLSAAAYANTSEEIDGQPLTVKYGPTDFATSISAGDVLTTRSDQLDAKYFAQIKSKALSAVRFYSPDSAEYLLESSVAADALANQPETHALADASVGYDFSVDTASVLKLAIFSYPPGASDAAYLYLNVFSVNAFGIPTYLRSGAFSGDGTPSFDLAPGTYGVTIGAYTEGGTPGNSPVNVTSSPGVSASVTLSIDSPALPPVISAAPEPEAWAMMMIGLATIGGIARGRRTQKPVRPMPV